MIFVILIITSVKNEKIHAAQTFFIERPRLALDFAYEYENDKRTGTTESDNTTRTFTEEFNLETNGWIYHPALLIYSLNFSPIWEQSTSRDTNTGDKTSKSFFSAPKMPFLLPVKTK